MWGERGRGGGVRIIIGETTTDTAIPPTANSSKVVPSTHNDPIFFFDNNNVRDLYNNKPWILCVVSTAPT